MIFFYQMQRQVLPKSATDYQRGDCVPQRGMDHVDQNHLEHNKSVAAAFTQRNHTGRRR